MFRINPRFGALCTARTWRMRFGPTARDRAFIRACCNWQILTRIAVTASIIVAGAGPRGGFPPRCLCQRPGGKGQTTVSKVSTLLSRDSRTCPDIPGSSELINRPPALSVHVRRPQILQTTVPVGRAFPKIRPFADFSSVSTLTSGR